MLLAVALACSPAPPSDDALRVLAPASLVDVLPEVAERWSARTGREVELVFDASSRLAAQLADGAEADVFVSADARWMDWAVARGLVDGSTRRDLLGNALVAVVPATRASADGFAPASPADLADPRIDRVALAGENVPAGRYAREALAGVWDEVADDVVDGASVRTALRWVAAGEADVGVVYATDARTSPDVRVAFAFPPGTHAPIVYPGAVAAQSADPALSADFLATCLGEGRPVFEAAGFTVLGAPPDPTAAAADATALVLGR